MFEIGYELVFFKNLNSKIRIGRVFSIHVGFGGCFYLLLVWGKVLTLYLICSIIRYLFVCFLCLIFRDGYRVQQNKDWFFTPRMSWYPWIQSKDILRQKCF